MGSIKGSGQGAYLFDTHTLLWAAHDESKLSARALSVIEDSNTHIFVSAVSAYEIMYKYKLGKLPAYDYVAKYYFDILQELGTDALPINKYHAHFAGAIEWSHRDPFDRLLAAQATTDQLILITNDSVFDELTNITTLW